MNIRFTTVSAVLGFGLTLVAGSAGAQVASAGQGASLSTVVANPSYASIHMEMDVNWPASEVWRRVGKYCDIAEWLPVANGCTILSGTDGEVGAVRSVANEVLVGKPSFLTPIPSLSGRDAPTTCTTARSKLDP